MTKEIDDYLEKAREQIEGRRSGVGSHTAALVDLILIVREQQKRIEQLESALRQNE